MSYVLAAYGIVLGSLGLYAWHLQRSRSALRKSLSSDEKSNHG